MVDAPDHVKIHMALINVAVQRDSTSAMTESPVQVRVEDWLP